MLAPLGHNAGFEGGGAAEMSDQGEALRVPAMRFERVLPGPVERVWAHLTNPHLLPGWFGAEGVIEPRQGGTVRFAEGHVRGVITQWRPHRHLACSWNVYGPRDADSLYPESYLSFDLAPEGAKVRLVLLHLPVLERFEAQNAMGWHSFLDMLDAALHGQKVEDRQFYMARNAARYGVDLNNLQR